MAAPTFPATPRVLITGGAGFIGRRVVTRALARDWRVANVSLPGEKLPAQLAGRVESIFGDIVDPRTLGQVRGSLDVVLHLASTVGVAGEYERQWQVMVEGTRQACMLAAKHSARVVVVSSVAVYGSLVQSRICHEADGHGPWQGAYGRAKQAQENIALELAAREGFPLTIVRPANVYGLGGTSAWGDRLLELIRSTGGAAIGSAENNNAGLTYVENLADALFLAMTHPAACGRTYNVCDGLNVTWRKFMDDMAALVSCPPPPAIPLEPLLAMANANEHPAQCIAPRNPELPFLEALNLVGFDNRFDSTAIRDELGWHPVINYEDARRQMRASMETEQR